MDMNNYKPLIDELRDALDALNQVVTLENFGDMTTASYKISRVMGTLQAWDNLQEEAMEEMAEDLAYDRN